MSDVLRKVIVSGSRMQRRRERYHLFCKIFEALPHKIVMNLPSPDEHERELMLGFELEYEKIYNTINNESQYIKYKADYMSVYKDYLSLSKEVRKVEKQFDRFLKSIENNEGNAENIKKIEEEMMKWYAKKKKEKFEVVKQKYDYLYGMLKRIRALVVIYEKLHKKEIVSVCNTNDTQSDNVQVIA